MRRAWLLGGIAVAAALAACGKSDRRVKRGPQDGGAATVPDPAGGAPVPADEQEPNGTDAEATLAPPGHVLRGTLASETDVDVYRVPVEEAAPGAQLRVMLTGIEGRDLVLELRDAAGAVLAKSDRGPAQVVEGVPGYGVVKGDYFVVVKEFVKKKKPEKKKQKKGAGAGTGAPDAGAPSPVYELTVELASQPPDLHEIEPNDDAGTAVEVLLADSVHGWIGWSGDVDLWKLSLENVAADYAVDIDVGAVDGVALTVDVLDAGGETLLTRKGAKGGPVVIKSLVPALGTSAPPWHFVRLSADRSNPEATYDLRFTARLREVDEEAEPNDDPARATPLRTEPISPSGATRATWSPGDVDRFLVDAQVEPSLLDVAVEPPTGVDLAIEVGAAGQPPLASANAAGAGGRERLTGVPLPAGTAFVVTVEARPSSAKTPKKTKDSVSGDAQPYRVVWSLTPETGDPMPPEETEPAPP